MLSAFPVWILIRQHRDECFTLVLSDKLRQTYTIVCKYDLFCFSQIQGPKAATTSKPSQLKGRVGQAQVKPSTVIFKLPFTWFCICFMAVDLWPLLEVWQGWFWQSLVDCREMRAWVCLFCYFASVIVYVFWELIPNKRIWGRTPFLTDSSRC